MPGSPPPSYYYPLGVLVRALPHTAGCASPGDTGCWQPGVLAVNRRDGRFLRAVVPGVPGAAAGNPLEQPSRRAGSAGIAVIFRRLRAAVRARPGQGSPGGASAAGRRVAAWYAACCSPLCSPWPPPRPHGTATGGPHHRRSRSRGRSGRRPGRDSDHGGVRVRNGHRRGPGRAALRSGPDRAGRPRPVAPGPPPAQFGSAKGPLQFAVPVTHMTVRSAPARNTSN